MSTTDTKIKERPILFTGAMVQAILGGPKTQTRRVLKDQGSYAEWKHAQKILPDFADEFPGSTEYDWLLQKEAGPIKDGEYQPIGCCHYGQTGDRWWVRETWQEVDDEYGCPHIIYKADGESWLIGSSDELGDHLLCPREDMTIDDFAICRWRSPIYMPRWASRLTLEVVSVRAERVQEISEADAKAEGVWGKDEPYQGVGDLARDRFQHLWDSINAKRGFGWDDNPWVWVVEFRKVEP